MRRLRFFQVLGVPRFFLILRVMSIIAGLSEGLILLGQRLPLPSQVLRLLTPSRRRLTGVRLSHLILLPRFPRLTVLTLPGLLALLTLMPLFILLTALILLTFRTFLTLWASPTLLALLVRPILLTLAALRVRLTLLILLRPRCRFRSGLGILPANWVIRGVRPLLATLSLGRG